MGVGGKKSQRLILGKSKLRDLEEDSATDAEI